VYGISGDNPFAQEAWAQKENIIVPLLSDYEHKVAKAYDVMYDSFLPQMNLGMGGVPKRSAFVVDKNGVVQYAESNDDARQLPDYPSASASCLNRCCAIAMAKKSDATTSRRWRTGMRNLPRMRRFPLLSPASFCRISRAYRWWSILPRCAALCNGLAAIRT